LRFLAFLDNRITNNRRIRHHRHRHRITFQHRTLLQHLPRTMLLLRLPLMRVQGKLVQWDLLALDMLVPLDRWDQLGQVVIPAQDLLDLPGIMVVQVWLDPLAQQGWGTQDPQDRRVRMALQVLKEAVLMVLLALQVLKALLVPKVLLVLLVLTGALTLGVKVLLVLLVLLVLQVPQVRWVPLVSLVLLVQTLLFQAVLMGLTTRNQTLRPPLWPVVMFHYLEFQSKEVLCAPMANCQASIPCPPITAKPGLLLA